jgi:hypothetical protein
MRLRRASAILVLSLLASAATAHAECAWVLWVTAGPVGKAKEASRRAAFETFRNCKTGAKAAVEQTRDSFDKAAQPVALDSGYMIRITTPKGERQFFSYDCWPDTVDLRGPKGK